MGAPAAFGDVSHHNRNHHLLAQIECVQPKPHFNSGTVDALQDHISAADSSLGLFHQLLEVGQSLWTDEGAELGTHDVLQRQLEQSSEVLVGVEDETFMRQGQGALAHLLGQQPVRLLRAGQCIDLVADHHRVHCPAADGLQYRLGFGQPQAQLHHVRAGVGS